MDKKNKNESIVKDVKVDSVSDKKEFNAKKLLNAFAKSLLGLYIIGLVLTLYELFIGLISPIMMSLAATAFMEAELVPLANFIAKPIRTVTWIVPMVVPIIVLSLSSIYLLDKTKLFTKKELKVYTLVMVVTSAFVLL